MKKKVALILLSMLCLSGIASAGWTPIRLCLYPEIAVPQGLNTYGLNIGFVTGQLKGSQQIAGLDVSLASTSSVHGVQASIVNLNRGDEIGTVGLQIAGANFGIECDGVQIAGINTADKSEVVQIGIWNSSYNGKGVQIGLFNLMDNGFLPFCPFINFSVD